jgi:hypothetical protein
MSEYSLCDGLRLTNNKAMVCPLRESCLRFTTQASAKRNWLNAPFIGTRCDHYMKVKPCQ